MRRPKETPRLEYESFPRWTVAPVTLIEEDNEGQQALSSSSANGDKLWIPDGLCSMCFACDQPFNLLRRRHHCRVCGLLFCHPCSAYYIDGTLLRMEGAVRACKSCSLQMAERLDKEHSSVLDILASEDARFVNGFYSSATRVQRDSATPPPDTIDPPVADRIQRLQQRASAHMEMVTAHAFAAAELEGEWRELVLRLTQSVVGSVSPDVRRGDDININHLVHVELVPGGSISDSRVVHGAVFKNNLANKRLRRTHFDQSPRFLLVAGAVEFQGAATGLLMMDKLLELEDKAVAILVAKIVSLRPDVLLAGGCVSHVITEKLAAHGVAVVHKVESEALLRVARITGAEILPLCDHIAHVSLEVGNDPIGVAASFSAVSVHDNPEHPSVPREGGIVKTKLSTDSSYIFIEGGDSKQGCSVFLRGGSRAFLARVSVLLEDSILLAYHLQLEVSFLADRDAYAPSASDDSESEDDDSDVEVSDSESFRCSRAVLSSSIDVSYGCIQVSDIRGAPSLRRDEEIPRLKLGCMQRLPFVSLLMADTTQKSFAENRRIYFYGDGDTSLGRFLIDNCFQPAASYGSTPTLLNQTLSFSHKPGRIDISVRRAAVIDRIHNTAHHVPAHLVYFLPITLSVHCKRCKSFVTPETQLSENSWRLSFGKFLDLSFYGRKFYGSSYGCSHSCRDHHVLHFHCSGLTAKVEFIPFHPFAINVREEYPLPVHWNQTGSVLKFLTNRSAALFEDFRAALAKLDQDIKDTLAANRSPEVLLQLMIDLRTFETEFSTASLAFRAHLDWAQAAMLSDPTLLSVYFRFPLGWKRDLLLMADAWNKQVRALYARLDEVRYPSEPFSFFKPRIEAEIPDPPEEPLNTSADDADVGSPFSQHDKTKATPVDDNLVGDDAFAGTRAADVALKTAPESEGRHDEKKSSISKALALFLGTDSSKEKNYSIPLTDIADSSLFLPPGAHGEVIAINESEPASIIAYSLASKEYQDDVLKFLRDDKLDSVEADENRILFSKPEDALDDAIGVKAGFKMGRSSSPLTVFMSPPETPKFDDLPPISRSTSSADFTSSVPEAATAHPVVSEATGVPAAAFSRAEAESPFERQMLLQRKSHVKHRFSDTAGSAQYRYFCTTYWSTQFEALRRQFFGDISDEGYIQSLSSTEAWTAQGGKSGATFSKTSDGRFVVKIISRTELLMFNDFAPAYFEHISKALFHGLPTVLCKIVGVYQVGCHNPYTGRRMAAQIVVMENLFFDHHISRVFDIKGSMRARYVPEEDSISFEEALLKRRRRRAFKSDTSTASIEIVGIDESFRTPVQDETKKVLLDDNFVQLNNGRPFPLKRRAKEYLEKAVSNDATFLSVVNVVDYSILVGFDEDNYCIKFGIIDFLRQYDIIKKMEHMSKSVGMVVGQAEPTIIEPLQYKRRFQLAIDRYFVGVPDMWTDD